MIKTINNLTRNNWNTRLINDDFFFLFLLTKSYILYSYIVDMSVGLTDMVDLLIKQLFNGAEYHLKNKGDRGGCSCEYLKKWKWQIYANSLQRLPLISALKGFCRRFKPAVWWTSINRCCHSFHALAKGRLFPRFSSTHGGRCRRLSRFYIILLQDLTLLHVKITRSTNLLSFCRRKIKLSTYLHTVSSTTA